MRATEFAETVNDKLFYQGYEHKKPILGGKYVLSATSGYVGYGAKPGYKSTQFRIVVKTSKGEEVGWVNFENKDDKLEALDLYIQPAHRRKGIGTEMYRFARELGNEIAPSKLQTGMGKQFWNKDHSKELNEIDYTPAIEPLQISFEQLAANAKIVGDIDNRDVWKYDDGHAQVYFVMSNSVDGLIIMFDNALHGIRNYSGEKGLITMLVGFVTHRLGIRVLIEKDEPFTPEGIQWLCSLIKSGGRGLKISDQNGNFPDADLLYAEWAGAMKSNDHGGPSQLTIENVLTRKLRTKEEYLNEGRHLMPSTWFIGSATL